MNESPDPHVERFLSGDADETDLRLLLDRLESDDATDELSEELRFRGMLRAAAVADADLRERVDRIQRVAAATSADKSADRTAAVMTRIATRQRKRQRPQTLAALLAVAAATILALALLPDPPPQFGTVAKVGVGYDLIRDGKTVPLADGVRLQHGDQIVGGGNTESLTIATSDGTSIVGSGPLTLTCRRAGPGRHLVLDDGRLNLDVEPQPPGFPLIILTPLARATVVGTTLQVVAAADETRLRVASGAVVFANRHEDRRVVEANQFAIAKRGETKLTGSQSAISPPPSVHAAHARWQDWSRELSQDPSLVVHYVFEADSSNRGWLANQAPPPDDPIFPRNLDGRIYKCTWSDGRFPGLKDSLLFQQDAYVNCGRDSAIPFDEPFTCLAWFKPLLIHSGWTGIVTTGLSGWGLQLNKEFDSVNFYYKTEVGYENARTQQAIAMNEWHFAVGIFDGTASHVYLDGKLLSSYPVTGTKTPFLDPLMIGGNFTNQPARSFQGWIDEVAVLRRVMTDAEIAAAYAAGKPD